MIQNSKHIRLQQTTGQSTRDAMSQKAITEKIAEKQDTLVSGQNIKTVNGNDITGSGDVIIASTGAAVVQNTGTSVTDVMSQKAVTDEIAQLAVQLLRLHDPNLVFSGFVNTTTATPAHTANKAYIATESGTIFGIAGVAKWQIVVDDGTNFSVESIKTTTVFNFLGNDSNNTISQLLFSQIAVKDSQSINKFDINDINKLSSKRIEPDGSYVSASTYSITGFISVKNEDIVIMHRGATNTPFFRAYQLFDKNYELIVTVSRISPTIGSEFSSNEDTRRVFYLQIDNENAAFIRVNYLNSYEDDMVIEVRSKFYNPRYFNSYTQYSEIIKPLIDHNSSQWNDKKMVITGDSIASGYIPYSGLNYIHWTKFISEYFNLNLVNYADGGNAIAVKESDETLRNPIALSYTEMDDDADLIIIAGGTNDWQYSHTPTGTFTDRTVYTFYGALHVLCIGLINKYLGKQIVFITPIQRYQDPLSDETATNLNGYTLLQYVDIIKEVCGHYGIPVLDMYRISNNLNPHFEIVRNEFMPDGVHPNTKGHFEYAKFVRGFIKNLYPDNF